jgi:hypothetical protein
VLLQMPHHVTYRELVRLARAVSGGRVTIETDKTVTISGCLSTKALSWMPRSS